MTKAKYDRNTVIFGPDRSDIEYKFDRLDAQAEDFKTDLEPIIGIVDGYDPITGIIDVIVDPNLPSIPVENGSGVYPNPGDTMIIQPIAGEYYGIGIVHDVTFPDHSLLEFVVPSSVPGTPRIPPTEMGTTSVTAFRFIASGADYVAYNTLTNNMLQVNISTGTSNTYVFTSIDGNSATYTNGTTAVGTNGGTNIEFLSGGVLTSVNYAGASSIKLGGYDGTSYCFCVLDTVTPKSTNIVRVDGVTGVHTVTDISSVFPAHDYTHRVCRAGDGYFAVWAGNNKTAAGNSIGMWVNGTIYAGIDSTTGINDNGRNAVTGFAATVGQSTVSLNRLDIEGGYLYWMFGTTGFYKMNLTTGSLTLYNDIFPEAFASVGSGSTARIVGLGVIGDETLVIAGGVTGLPVFYLTDGVTTTQIVPDLATDTNHWGYASGDGTTGYVYYQLAADQDFIVGVTI